MAHLEKASELNSDTELTALGWLILGESILYSDPTHAASCLTRATALNPNHARAWGVLSQAHLRAHELVEAEQAALHWTTLDPESSDAWQNLGAVYYTDDKFTEASHAFEQAAEFRQDSSPIWCDLAASLQMLGLLDAAVLALKRASEAEPTDPVPVARHGSIRFYQENFAEAAEVLAHAISLPSPPAEAYTLLGKSYQALNRPEEALAAFRQAVEFKPENPEAWEDLCLALTRAGLVEEAGAAMQKALDLQNQESAAFELDAPTTV
jgi:Flp pilus assembly protein TadD